MEGLRAVHAGAGRDDRAAIDATADLPAHIAGSDPPPPDASNATFTLKGRTIEVDEWPKAAPRLERLLTTIAQLRKKPPVPSTWRLWSDGAVVELEARCDIGEVAALRAISDALFMDNATDEAPAGDDPPDGTPLVSVAFGEEHLEVFADGKRVDRAGGKETTQKLGSGPRQHDPQRARRDRLGEAAEPALLDAHRQVER